MPSTNLRPCLFLDRDGVINESIVRAGKPFPPASLEEFRYLAGIDELVRETRKAGWLIVVATNQPDVGRGAISRSQVEEIHEKIQRDFQFDAIQVCYDPGQNEPSERRKPAPGMLLEAAESLDIDLSSSIMLGDRWRDIDCGAAAGCRTIFLDHGYQEALRHPPDFRVTNLAATLAVLRKIWSGSAADPTSLYV